MRLEKLGEFNLIDRISKKIRLSSRVIKGIGDDTAVLKYNKDSYLLFTCDMLLEDRHFYRRSGGYLVGRKSLSANISDIAAMGGVPKFAVISLGVPASLDIEYVDNLYKGIKSVAKKFKVDLVGGDTICSRKIVIDIALLGEVEKKDLVLRKGAKEGDAIFVTGEIGGSLKGKHLNFIPRLKEARFLVKNFKVNSMIDVSDGLLADLGHILKFSRKGAVIYEKDIPISKDAKDFDSAVSDGEDFELIFTVSVQDAEKLIEKWPFKTRLSMIGKIINSPRKLYLVKEDSKKIQIEPVGYSHF
jgi:thiamine-monophosphate kinase